MRAAFAGGSFLAIALACGSTSFPDDTFGGASGGVSGCSTFNANYTLFVRSVFPKTNADAGADAGMEADADVDDDAGSSSPKIRITKIAIEKKGIVGFLPLAKAFLEDDGGARILDVRYVESASANQREPRLEIDVDTTASNQLVLRVTTAIECFEESQVQAIREPVLLNIRLLSNGRPNTARASIAKTAFEEPVPILEEDPALQP